MDTQKKLQEELIREMHLDGKSQRKISDMLKVSRHTVSNVLKEKDRTKTPTPNGGSTSIHNYEQEILNIIESSKMSIRLIHSKLQSIGINTSYTTLTRYIRTLKNKEVYVPVITNPGQEAQVDFGYFGYFVRNGKPVKVWVFNMVLSYSRYAYYREVTDQTLQTFIRCHMEAFEFFGGVPLTVKIDNLRAGVLKADIYEPTIQKAYANFLSHYNVAVVTARAYRGQDKGKVEAGIKYVKNSFLKGIEHSNYQQLGVDLKEWNKKVCNLRTHGTTRKIPQQLFFDHEKKLLRPLPAQRYLPASKLQKRTVGPYGHIFFEFNYYSVPHELVGQSLDLESDGYLLRVFHNNVVCATHPLCAGKGQFITIDAHKPHSKRHKSEDSYIQRMATLGNYAVTLLKSIQAKRPHHWHKMANGILNLNKIYPASRIEEACRRALHFEDYSFQAVKKFCETGNCSNDIFPALPKTIGGHFHNLDLYDNLGY